MAIYKLLPAIKRPVWSGNKIEKWNKKGCDGLIGETWELSFLEGNESVIDGGEKDGAILSNVLTRKDWGKASDKFAHFPMLVKFIDASQNLSVQVHPDEQYAKKTGLNFGKTEAWFVMACDENAGLYLGFKRDTDKAEVEDAIKNGKITDLLNFVKVKKGDCFFVAGGTVHAIGTGVTVAEIQQSSDVTYRVYDYGRLGVDGKPRELHIDSALKVMDFSRYTAQEIDQQPKSLKCKKKIKKLAQCEYFTFYLNDGENELYSPDSFVCVVCVDGEGKVNGLDVKKGETFFVTAGEKITLSGNVVTLIAGIDL